MRASSLNTITQYAFIIFFAVILPVHCMVHCAHHDTLQAPRSPYVCILHAQVSPTHTQLLPQAYQPSAIHEAVSFWVVQTAFADVHRRIAQSVYMRKKLHDVQPEYPPPRQHAHSIYSL